MALLLLLPFAALQGWGAEVPRDCQRAIASSQGWRWACRGAQLRPMRELAEIKRQLAKLDEPAPDATAERPLWLDELLWATQMARLERLVGTVAEAEALYVMGWQLEQRHADPERKRQLFERAARGFALRGLLDRAARAADFAARTAKEAGDFELALALADRADQHAKRSGDRLILGRAAAMRAEIYDFIGLSEQASDLFAEAEELTEDDPQERAHIYAKHGSFLVDRGDQVSLQAALVFFDLADRDKERAIALGKGAAVKDLRISLLLNRADAYSRLGRFEEAQAALVGVEPETEDDRRYHALVLGYLAARRGDADTAAKLFERAERAFQGEDGEVHGADSLDYQLQIALDLSRAYADRDDRKGAEQSLRLAISAVDKLRQRSADLNLRPWILARRSQAYKELFALLLTDGRDREAVGVAEALYAQTWLDAALGVRPPDGSGHALLEDVRRRLRMLAAPGMTAAPSAFLTPGVLPAELEVLLYLELDGRIWRGHLRGDGVHFEMLEENAAARASAFINDPDDEAKRTDASAALLPLHLAAGDAPLYVIAYGALADLPFAALQRGSAFLIQTRAVARIPGLAALRCRAGSWSEREVLLGDAAGDRPEAASEVRRLSSRPGADLYLHGAATRAVLLGSGNARLLHVATHSAPKGDGRVLELADGSVSPAELLEHDVAPELAVLSGCATSTTDNPEGWNGFPSALLAAGSRHVIATLRTVEDAPAARLMHVFYSRGEPSPIERLAAAQRALIGELTVKQWSDFAAWGADDCGAELAARAAPAPPPAHR